MAKEWLWTSSIHTVTSSLTLSQDSRAWPSTPSITLQTIGASRWSRRLAGNLRFLDLTDSSVREAIKNSSNAEALFEGLVAKDYH